MMEFIHIGETDAAAAFRRLLQYSAEDRDPDGVYEFDVGKINDELSESLVEKLLNGLFELPRSRVGEVALGHEDGNILPCFR